MAKTHTDHTDSATLIRALDAAEYLPGAVALRERGYELLRLKPDATVVDVGCGTGRAVAELAERGARAIGVDLDPAMLTAARERFPGIDVRAADATDVPLADGGARGYRADKVLHILPEPDAALAEARRVLAPGGPAAVTSGPQSSNHWRTGRHRPHNTTGHRSRNMFRGTYSGMM